MLPLLASAYYFATRVVLEPCLGGSFYYIFGTLASHQDASDAFSRNSRACCNHDTRQDGHQRQMPCQWWVNVVRRCPTIDTASVCHATMSAMCDVSEMIKEHFRLLFVGILPNLKMSPSSTIASGRPTFTVICS